MKAWLDRRKKAIIGTVIPFFSFFLVITFLGGHEWYIALVIALALVPVIRFGYMKGEWTIFVLGAVFGLVIEVGLDRIYREQFWANASLYTVPVWLPLVWGGGFVLIRRFTDLIVVRHST